MAFEGIHIQLSEESIYKIYPLNPTYQGIEVQLSEDSVIAKNYQVRQFGNFYLMKEVSAGVWEAANAIDLNPKNDTTIQTLLNTYSGTPGKHVFTAQELHTLCSGSSGNLVRIFAESVDSSLGIAGDDLQTNLAKIETTTGKTIWSYEVI